MGSEKVKETPKDPGVQFDHPAFSRPRIVDHEQALVEVIPRRKKVAIVGFATSSRDLAPFDDPEWEIWALNQLYRWIPRVDRWFEIHKNWNEHVVEGTDHLGWLQAAPIPVYMTQRIAEIPNSVRYPLERAIERFTPYFTSTIAYMLALAILEDFETIGLFGIDLIVGTEYFEQKACVERLMGIADGMGKTVLIPGATALCKAAYLYGYQLEPDWGPLNLSTLQKRRAYLAAERDKTINQARALDGALQEAEYWLSWLDLKMKGGDVPPNLGH
ncbi:MAG: hypothetical protein ACE5JH_12815 [Acidobacteriota bacterium]